MGFALAWMVGEEGRGVPTIIEMVAMTRFDCMVGSSALMRQAPASRAAPTWMLGVAVPWNLSALPIRLRNTWPSCRASAATTGSASWVTQAPVSSRRARNCCSVSASTAPSATGCSGRAWLLMRARLSRSLISAWARLPPSTTKPRNSCASVVNCAWWRRISSWP